MLYLIALFFAVLTALAGVYGFGSYPRGSPAVARIIFFAFLLMFLVTIIRIVLRWSRLRKEKELDPPKTPLQEQKEKTS